MKTYHMAELETAQDELLDMIADLVNQACHMSEGDYPCGHCCMSVYQQAFDILERNGRLKYRDGDRYWARLYTTEEEGK